jgi:hypothetical protein
VTIFEGVVIGTCIFFWAYIVFLSLGCPALGCR